MCCAPPRADRGAGSWRLSRAVADPPGPRRKRIVARTLRSAFGRRSEEHAKARSLTRDCCKVIVRVNVV